MHAGAVGTNDAPGNTEGEKPAYVSRFKKKGQRFSGTAVLSNMLHATVHVHIHVFLRLFR